MTKKLAGRFAQISLIAFSLSFGFGATAFAITFPDKPDSENFFVDEANLIGEKEAQEINEIALGLLLEEKVPLFVVTIPSLATYQAGGYSIEGYAADLFDEWGIGSKERNYGMLLIVSKGDRKARISLGADWGREYDRNAKQIMDTLIVPAFKQGDFALGIVAGVRGMDALARGLALPKPVQPWWILPLMIGVAIGLVLLIINLFKTGRSGWAWALIAFIGVALFFMLRASASSGGSSGGFGGGFSGGGGASGSW